MTATCRACGGSWPFDPAMQVSCPKCNRAAGQGCVRPSGHPCEVHAARDQLAMEAGLLQPCPGKPVRATPAPLACGPASQQLTLL